MDFAGSSVRTDQGLIQAAYGNKILLGALKFEDAPIDEYKIGNLGAFRRAEANLGAREFLVG